jgi:adenine specific DNA methylase Mod
MMAVRLVELHRVLKDSGSLYLHCDPTASHYLKLVLDAVFGGERFVNEITWKRSHAHSDAKQGARHFGRQTDIIFFYSKSAERTWNPLYTAYDQS